MPVSPAESYLSAIAPAADLPPCIRGFEHSFRVTMGSKQSNAHEIGRRYSYCHGPVNKRCVISDKGPVLSIIERDLLRKKLDDFKAQLKADKQEVRALSSAERRAAPQRKRNAQSISDEPSDEDEAGGGNKPSSNHTVQIYMYFGDSTVFVHDGEVANGLYCFQEDIRFREYSSWPQTRWLMFDVVQNLWIDIPTLAKIKVGSGPLLTRCYDPAAADLSTYEGLDCLIEEAQDTYEAAIENSRLPSRSRSTPQVPSSSQTLPRSSSPASGPSHRRKRTRMY